MATDNRVRVLFEAVMDNFQRNVRQGIRDVLQIGDAAEEAGEESRQGFNRASRGLENVNNQAGRFKDTLKTIAKLYVGKKFLDFGKYAATEFGKTQTALGEMASLGYNDLETLRQKAVEFANTWSGTTRDEFIKSAYDIKSGIATLTDEGVAEFTKLAAVTGKATKATTAEMTTLFAQGYGIYRDLYNSDFDFGEKFSAGIAKSVQRFRTQGTEMSGYLTTLGANAKNAGKELDEILTVGGLLQQTNTGSEAATMYNSFLTNAMNASKKLKMSFVGQNGQLLSTVEILNKLKNRYGDVLEAEEKAQIKGAFGRIEAVKFIDLLYNKTQNLKGVQKEVSQAIGEGTQATEKMASTMNKGLLEKWDILKHRVSNIADQIGEKMAPTINVAMDNLFDAMDRAAEDGTLDNLAANIGNIYSTLINKGAELISNIDDIASSISNFTGFISDNLEVILFAAEAWMVYKTAMAIGNIIKTVTISMEALTTAQWGLNAAMDANPIGIIITLVGMLILALVHLAQKHEWARVILVVGWNTIKGMFLLFVYWHMWGMNIIVQGISKVLSLIPGIGDKFEGVAKASNSFLQSIQEELGKTKDAIVNVNDTPIDIKAKEDAEYVKNVGYAQYYKMRSEEYKKNNKNNKTSLPGKDNISAGVPTKDETIQDAIKSVTSKYDDKLDLYESRADLAKSRDDSSGVKLNKSKIVATLKEEAAELLGMQNRVKGKSKNIVEAARNKILTKIASIAEDIKGGISKMVGEFNKPSELKAMTKYQYAIDNSKKNLKKTAVVAPNIKMYLTIEDTGNKGREKIQREVMPLLDIFNSTSEKALTTITRNG